MSDRRLKAEVWIVVLISLGRSGVYSAVNLLAAATATGGIRASTATLNRSQSDREYFDLTYQLLGVGFALVPVALALYLLVIDHDERSVTERLGLDRRHVGRDLLWGAGLAALIGLPGIGLYYAGRALGVTAQIVLAPDNAYWWTVPLLVLAAVQNAVLEEVVVIGYLTTRLRQLRWGVPATIVTAALLRGSYHLYQGVGAGLGNVVMGLVFGYWFHRTKRLWPLIVAHTILDVFAFVGYLALGDALGLK